VAQFFYVLGTFPLTQPAVSSTKWNSNHWPQPTAWSHCIFICQCHQTGRLLRTVRDFLHAGSPVSVPCIPVISAAETVTVTVLFMLQQSVISGWFWSAKHHRQQTISSYLAARCLSGWQQCTKWHSTPASRCKNCCQLLIYLLHDIQFYRLITSPDGLCKWLTLSVPLLIWWEMPNMC